MKIKAPFAVETRGSQMAFIMQAGYTMRQFLQHQGRSSNGRRRRLHNWWLWGYVQGENRPLSTKELQL